ncbi:Orotate phosphoribosyltransferase [Penicillium brevicompactum]|uniref:Orotate phosphoribosyltransferase n=1 Tax=Penicillium brevicompactum TaxID=5074 RepID=A0A9W9R919_PENBR|nr:Orotate phosphoribosyltransferase [Penicillium brevicompactum]KAJ5363054.1 Orotate phosphoribosyltransferase [Penicillium brevicompactum]
MSAAPTPAAGQDYKSSLLDTLIRKKVLAFDHTYTLKSGRESPYFFNSSLLHTAPLLRATSSAYASVISSPPFVDDLGKPTFDIIFGPAYKGIPICAAAINELAVRDHLSGTSNWDNVSYSFNRKEAKSHGEGGSIVGAPLMIPKDLQEQTPPKRVVIVDDVITAGTAIREAIEIIKKNGATLVGIVVLLDREELGPGENETRSAIGALQSELPTLLSDQYFPKDEKKRQEVHVRSVLGLHDLIDHLDEKDHENDIKRLKAYREKWGAQ